MKKFILGAAALMSVAGAAEAATVIVLPGFGPGNAMPDTFSSTYTNSMGGVTTFFEGIEGDVTGLNVTLGVNSSMFTGSTSGVSAAPFTGPGRDPSQYLSVTTNGEAFVTSTSGLYNAVSLYWGSVDDYNFIDLLDSNGKVIDTISGGVEVDPAGGNQSIAQRVDIFTQPGENSIASVRFYNTRAPAFEISNVTFFSAVPEPATWMMMLAGFGILGGVMRRRNSNTRTQMQLV